MESDYDEVKRKPMAGKIMYLHDHATTSQYSVGLEDGRQSHRESSTYDIDQPRYITKTKNSAINKFNTLSDPFAASGLTPRRANKLL
jgi:hypothetical protein